MSPGSADRGVVRRHLMALAGFRNALVHGDLGVDLAIVHGVLDHHLARIREFAVAVSSHVTGVA